MLSHLVLGRAMMQVDHVDLRGPAGDHGARAGIVSRLVHRCTSACAALALRPAQRARGQRSAAIARG